MRPFSNRQDAGRQLGRALGRYAGKHPLILGVPRGGVPVASAVATALGGDLDLVLVRKLRAPGNAELAIGAVDESGETFLTPYARMGNLKSTYLQQERLAQLETLKRRRASLTPGRKSISPRGRIAIVVDDGVATGSSMIAALQAVRQYAPARLICAVPVAPSDALRALATYADEVVCLATPDDFAAVGEFYEDFAQVSDDEVLTCLKMT
ncbi:phosphoribosyltransferase [Pandoraea sputorum]|uniref:phosphoribosyltransferase n=1 Tax=Pandoraea sputorum TaxID=93222 RepID=UPI00124290F1|nr:phosphoribosyltransferase family protein [Pandoraea sputorum]VVD84916.1 phosphoribosyl transferase [Pandoraea sputorum]